MKILFSADEHLCLRRKKVEKQFEINRYRNYFDLMISKARELDAVIVHGGDFFDRYPTFEEVCLFLEYTYRTWEQGIEVYMIPGNHEMIRNETFLQNQLLLSLLPSNFHMILEYSSIGDIDFIPYNTLQQTPKLKPHNNILVTHVRGEIPPHVKPEIDLDTYNRWNIVFAGDLHSHQNTQRNIIYPGSPMSITFHKEKLPTNSKGLIVFDTEDPENYDWFETNLPGLIRKEISSTKQDRPRYDEKGNYIAWKIVGDMESVGDVKLGADRIDDVEIQEKTEEPLLFDTVDTLKDELHTYLSKVINLSPKKIDRIFGKFNDLYKESEME